MVAEREYTLDDMVQLRFEANKQRGMYLAHIVRELERSDLPGSEEALKKAAFAFGKAKSEDWGNLDAKQFTQTMMPNPVSVGTMEFRQVGEATGERSEFTFGRCPLETGWREMGLSAAERKHLCKIASQHDFGLVDNGAGLSLEIPETLGGGDSVCRLILSKAGP